MWTLKERGEGHKIKGVELDQCSPTAGHWVLNHLTNANLLRLTVSTNVDGLHRRSGLNAEQLAELHGNCYKGIILLIPLLHRNLLGLQS